MNTTTIYLTAAPHQPARKAWLDSEGLYICANHRSEGLASMPAGYELVAVPLELAAEVQTQGNCEICWENWSDGLRRSFEADAAAAWES